MGEPQWNAADAYRFWRTDGTNSKVTPGEFPAICALGPQSRGVGYTERLGIPSPWSWLTSPILHQHPEVEHQPVNVDHTPGRRAMASSGNGPRAANSTDCSRCSMLEYPTSTLLTPGLVRANRSDASTRLSA